MKLIAFEVRDDEMGTFKRLEKEHNLEITYHHRKHRSGRRF